jgi:hypothetical protein
MDVLRIGDGKEAAAGQKEGSGKDHSFRQNGYILSALGVGSCEFWIINFWTSLAVNMYSFACSIGKY